MSSESYKSLAIHAKIQAGMIKRTIQKLIKDTTGVDTPIEKPKSGFGDYASNVAFLARKPAVEIVKGLKGKLPKEIERIEAKNNYINFFLSNEFVQSELERIADTDWELVDNSWANKVVMVEYTDPNPFKLFHIGHLMSNAIGESIARLYEASGAKVIRVTWQGDVGMHIAMAVWGMKQGKDHLGEAYAVGSNAYRDGVAKEEIEAINKKIYDKSDPEINALYQKGRQGSLEYFEKQYNRLGSKFDRYFFESEEGPKGLELVNANSEIFTKSNGAIVFAGERYGLHTRVFVNSHGLPTYEAKELGLNQEKFKLYNPDLSLIVTGSEIIEYFKVLMKAMELTMSDVAEKTRHIPHGMLRLPTGKMSSRTGDVITADWLIDEVKKKVKHEEVAIGAIKYTILKQGIGHDIVFDFEKSLSVSGDSGVYLQYTYARMRSILAKNTESRIEGDKSNPDYKLLVNDHELQIIKHLVEFPDVVQEATERIAPHIVALYLYELANFANRYYEEVRILNNENDPSSLKLLRARLVLVQTIADILKRGLGILGIKTLEKI
jgi:arginyl-tRNA synthetase